MSDYTEDLLSLLNALQLPSYTFIGHSMSGKIALSIAARQPAGLRSLVLVAPSPPSPELMKEEDRSSFLEAFQNREVLTEKLSSITARPLPEALLKQAVNASEHRRSGNSACQPKRTKQ